MAEQEKIMKASEYLSKMNVQLNDEDLLFASGGAGSSSSAAYKVGDTVRLGGQTQVGEVIAVNKNDVSVAFGQITTVVKANRLEAAQPVKVQDVRTATYVSKQTNLQMIFFYILPALIGYTGCRKFKKLTAPEA